MNAGRASILMAGSLGYSQSRALPGSIDVAAHVRYVQRVVVPCNVTVLAYRLKFRLGLDYSLDEFSLAATAKASARP